MKKVSVIIPAYRCSSTLRQAIDSALIQEVPLEILVLDDCSGEDIEGIVKEYGEEPRLRYLKNEKNLGAAASRNRGVQLASGDYESMYVALDAQVVVSDLNKLLSDNVTVQTVDDERFVLCARQASTFGIDAVPVGSGRLCGIAGIYEGAYAVMPCTGSDITMSSPRFDGGITLPYVLSIMTKTATNGDGKYIFYSGTNR